MAYRLRSSSIYRYIYTSSGELPLYNIQYNITLGESITKVNNDYDESTRRDDPSTLTSHISMCIAALNISVL